MSQGRAVHFQVLHHRNHEPFFACVVYLEAIPDVEFRLAVQAKDEHRAHLALEQLVRDVWYRTFGKRGAIPHYAFPGFTVFRELGALRLWGKGREPLAS